MIMASPNSSAIVAVREPDPITVEVLRSRLDAIGREAGLAIERTAISPVVSETKDYSVTISDAAGRLITGIGYITAHYGASVSAVRATMARHGDSIAPGDVFLANDPHNGGGLHDGEGPVPGIARQVPGKAGEEMAA